jgi:ParB family chromosome partitioning protein
LSYQQIELRNIKPNRLNPRREFTPETLKELADSIGHTGVLQPLIVRPTTDGYEIVVGERRYRAAQRAGLTKVPAIVQDYTDDQVAELNLIENIQREDLTGVEKGRAVRSLLEQYPKKFPNIKAIAQAISYSENQIRGWLELGQAPTEVQDLVAPIEKIGIPRKKGTIDTDTAIAITRRISEPRKQIAVARALAKAPIYRREARKVVQEASLHPEKDVEEIIERVLEEPASIPFMPEHVAPITKGVKVQTSRKGVDPKIRPGAKVAAYTKFAELRVTQVTRKKLGDFTAEDAKREGGYSLEEFKSVWRKLHGDWNPQETVSVVTFKVERVTI